MTLDRVEREWPQQQIDDYIAIINAEAHVSNENNGNNTSGSASTTEAAYQAMRDAGRG